jgi:hypothetical protein
MKEKLIINSEAHEVDFKNINLIFNKDHLNIKYPERTMISCIDSLKYFNEIKKIDKYTACLFKMTVPDFFEEINKENIEKQGDGYKHLVGLYSLTIKFISQNKKFGWSYPESFLHPAIQLNLADILILLSNNFLLKKFLICVNENKFDNYLKGNNKNLKDYFFNVICNGNLKNFIFSE